MDTVSIIFLACFLVAVGTLVLYATLTEPPKIRRGRTVSEANETPAQRRARLQRQVKLARSVPLDGFEAWAMDLGDAFARLAGVTPEDESTPVGARIVQLLKSADWYWEQRTDYPPTPQAPFWNLTTYWAAKGAYTLVGAILGLVLAGFIAWAFGSVYVLPFGALVGGWMGFRWPDDSLEAAARNRQNMLTIELGFGVPKMFSIFQRNPSQVDSLRELVEGGGGPFIEEMSQVLIIYQTARNLSEGLDEMIRRNTNNGVREFCTSIKMAVERRGGDLTRALAKQSFQAREQMKRFVVQRSARNAINANGQAVFYATILIFILFVIPIALLVAQSMAGGS